MMRIGFARLISLRGAAQPLGDPRSATRVAAALRCCSHPHWRDGSRGYQTRKQPPPPTLSSGSTRLVNSITHQKEELKMEETLTWYTCGPTVYDHAHVGHARAYVALDIVRRVLESQGYVVFQVMGVTDVDDKIIARAKQIGVPALDVASEHERGFLRDMRGLNVAPAHALTRVSEHIPDIVDFIKGLLDGGYAYVGAETGTVLFDVLSYGDRYGVLEPSRKMFGDEPPCPVLHSGGRDLRFPHHENEIAQSQALLGTDRWVQHWVHAGQLSIRGLKMSKSLKNFVTIRDYLAGGGSPTLWRLFCLLHRYSADIEWSPEGEAEAKAWERSFSSFFAAVRPVAALHRHPYAAYESSPEGAPLRWPEEMHQLNDRLAQTRHQVADHLRDDIDTPSAMRRLKDLMGETQRVLGDLEARGVPLSVAWPLVGNIASYVRLQLESWGLDCTPWVDLGGGVGGGEEGGGGQGEALLDALLGFRDKVRAAAVGRMKAPGGKEEALPKDLLGLCDELRDVTLPSLGVVVGDKRAGGGGKGGKGGT